MTTHGEQLVWLSRHEPALQEVICAAGEQRGWWRSGCVWSRRFARWSPSDSPYYTLLFEAEDALQQYLCLVEVYTQPGALQSEAEMGLAYAPLGWIKLTRFPYDAALPTLEATFEATAQARVVRYRPHKRCTLRVTEAAQVSYAKVFPNAHGADVHASAVLLWDACARGELGFHVAQPLRWDPAQLCMWQAQAPGEPAEPHLQGERGALVAHGLGRALATLSRSSVPLSAEFDAAWQFARTARYARDLAVRAPQVAFALDALLADFDRAHARLEPAALVSLHGAPHPQQWLTGPQGYSLVDFDRCGRGDAELDVATFVAEVDFHHPKRYDIARINVEFVRGFESIAGPLDPLRFGLYRAHKHVAKALRFARSTKPEGAAKAAALIDHVRANLTAMCASTTARTWALAKDWTQRASVLCALIALELQNVAVGVRGYMGSWL